MSSNEEDYNDQDNSPGSALQSLKKRRIQRACDICRRKKIRCDGVQMPGNRCSNCIAYNFECTYVEAAKKRGPPKGYVESLENKLDKLEKLLRRLCPDENLLRELDSSLDQGTMVAATSSVFTGNLNPAGGTTPQLTAKDPREIASTALQTVHNPINADDDNAHLILADNLKLLSIDPVDYRFFGKSSGAMLIQTAIELKNEYTGSDDDLRKAASVLGSKREEFWSPHPWERSTSSHKRANYVFPEPELIGILSELYFQHANLYLPLLHRPTFENLVAEGYHLQNDSFASTLLLVCAIGSRSSDDPRVLLDGEESAHSSGWKWFDQVQMVKKSLLAPPSLYDLQFYCLSVQFLQGSSAPQSCWTMVGIGIRLAQDVGAHRRKAQKGALTVEDELWKRAFWVLVCMDRMVSAALGRPCAIQDEDFDLDMPIECDDEYWEHPDPEQRWKQPPGKPSLISAFNLYLKLNQVLAFSLRTIYSINKSKILLGFVGQQWEQHIVAELDSALNKWVDSVPDHLRWDPNREDDNFFYQSVVLYAAYYHIQILIHRPFIPSPSKPSPLSFPSLAICTNAARSCSHVVDVQLSRNPMPPPQVQMAVFTSGIVLLLSIWGGKRSGLSSDPNKEMADVHKCMRVLRTCEKRWHSAGRLWDILYELASVGDLPLPQASPPWAQKREREGETPTSSPLVKQEVPLPGGLDVPRPIAGSKRVTSVAQQMNVPGRPPASSNSQQRRQSLLHSEPSSDNVVGGVYSHQDLASHPSQEQQQQQQYFSLPVYSDELGRLPLHGQIEFSSPQQGMTPHYWYSSSQPGGTTNVNVSVNVNLAASPPDPLTSGARSISEVHRRSIDGMHSGFEYHPRSSGMDRAGLSGTSGGYGMDGGGPGSIFNQLDVMSFPGSGMSEVYHGGGGGGGSPAGSSSRPMMGHPSHYSVMGPPQHQHAGASHQHQGMQGHGSSAPLRYPATGGALHQSGPGPRPDQQQNYVDSDTMAMWSNAPTGFELDEWGSYLMNVSELTQGGQAQQPQLQPLDGQREAPSGQYQQHRGHGSMHR